MKAPEGGNGIIEREKSNRASSHSNTSVQHSVDIKLHTLLCVKQMASGKLLESTGSSAWCSVMTSRDGKESQEGGGNCILTPESLRCTAATNTTLYSNYAPINTNAHLM